MENDMLDTWGQCKVIGPDNFEPFSQKHIRWDQTLYKLTLNDKWVTPSAHVVSQDGQLYLK